MFHLELYVQLLEILSDSRKVSLLCNQNADILKGLLLVTELTLPTFFDKRSGLSGIWLCTFSSMKARGSLLIELRFHVLILWNIIALESFLYIFMHPSRLNHLHLIIFC